LRHPPAGTDHLSQGEDEFKINVAFTARHDNDEYPFNADKSYTAEITLTWNDIFGAVAPALINEASDGALRASFRAHYESQAREALATARKLRDRTLRDFEFEDSDIDTCRVQLRALGLIRESNKQRSVRDTGTYWTLTPYGDYLMTQLRAIRRESPTSGTPAAASEPEEK
jgi:hypothetical protein